MRALGQRAEGKGYCPSIGGVMMKRERERRGGEGSPLSLPTRGVGGAAGRVPPAFYYPPDMMDKARPFSTGHTHKHGLHALEPTAPQ